MISWQRFRQSMSFLLIITFLPFFCIHPQTTKLDESDLEETMRNPWKADRSKFITDWLILGPVPVKSAGELDKDFLAGYKGEENLKPSSGDSISISGNMFKWTEVTCKDIVDLQKYYQRSRNEDAVAYAYAKINMKKDGKVYFYLGSDDGIKVRLNGKTVHRVLKDRALLLDEDFFEGDMAAGENHLLLKIQQSKGGWGFAVRMMEDNNQLNFITGNIEFSLAEINPDAKTINVVSNSNLDKNLMRQKVKMEVYTAGGKIVSEKTYECPDPVILNYSGWPDGPYEFRFTYNDVRGTKFVKYTTWFKGDILAAARVAVNSAPDKSVREPDKCLHRMLADMIMDRLGSNLEDPDSAKLSSLFSPLMELAEIESGGQIRPGGFIRLAYIDDIDNTPQFCKCYLPLNYDPAKKWPLVVYLHGYIQNIPEYYRIWDIDRRHAGASDKEDVIYIEPHGRGNTSYTGIGDRDVLKCIELAEQKFNVDRERIYLTGASMGGYGTWNVATRHPELFAAIAPIFGGGDYHVNIPKDKLAKLSGWEVYLDDKFSTTSQMESLLNMPVLVSHGDKDQSVNVNLSRYIVRMLQRWDYNVRYIEVPGKGHEDLGLDDQIINWLLQYKRNDSPNHVRIRAADLRNASAYWAEVTKKIIPAEFIDVDAEVLQGNIIRVDSKNADEMVLSVPAKLIDYKKTVKVVWNGKIIPVENNPSGKIVLSTEGTGFAAVSKNPRLAGPIADYQNTPYLIVAGTISKDSVMRKLISMKAEMMMNDWKSVQKYEPRFKKDIDVTESDMRDYTLYLLGGPEDNEITAGITGKIPIDITSDQIIVAGKSFKAGNAVVNAIFPNPFNAERYVVIAAANSGTGFYFFDPRNGELNQYDFYISDGKIPNYSSGAKNEKILVASGFFDNNWKLNDAYYQKGRDELRSKCAYMELNNDLSAKIVSSESPSEELLKAYGGVYQLENGPQIKVALENGKLIASQPPSPQSFELTAVSGNEFYIPPINVTLAFNKDENTGQYSMTVYQTGGEFALKKIK